jgi:hypothetical protein
VTALSFYRQVAPTGLFRFERFLSKTLALLDKRRSKEKDSFYLFSLLFFSCHAINRQLSCSFRLLRFSLRAWRFALRLCVKPDFSRKGAEIFAKNAKDHL